MATQVVILAAGKGARMKSSLPKVLHPLAGKPLITHVITTAQEMSPTRRPIIVYGFQGEQLREKLSDSNFQCEWVEQKEQLGTAHALLQALPHIDENDQVLILYGDVPLITAHTLTKLIQATSQKQIGLVTALLDTPAGYGRIKRDAHGNVIAIVEDKDASDDEKRIKEINPGMYYAPASFLKNWLTKINNTNKQHEFYLTDIIAQTCADNIMIQTVSPIHVEEILGVNDRIQLNQLERFYQRQLAEKLMRDGVSIADPNRFDVRGELNVGMDTYIDINCLFEGSVTIGRECVIGPNVFLKDTVIADGCIIKANSYIEGATIEAACTLGPFARVRPATHIASKVNVGNFVEIKNCMIGTGTKINHLSYVGDCDVGKYVNVGAGTITCNYDGANKHKSAIGDYAFVGSDTQLVAPVTIGAGATIGAGSTITKDVPPNSLTLTHRLEQRSHIDWKRPEKV